MIVEIECPEREQYSHEDFVGTYEGNFQAWEQPYI